MKALLLAEPAEKAAAARWLQPAAADAIDRVGTIDTIDTIDIAAVLHPTGPLPGCTERPNLVAPAALKRRSPFTPEGRAALLHAVAHIELNAINLALEDRKSVV